MPSALLFVFRAYLVQGLAAGAMTAVLMPTLIAGGMDLKSYSEQSALALVPWCIKLAWAPAIDRYTKHRPHLLRRWVAFAQLAVGCATLLMLGIVDIENSRWGWGLLWLVMNTGLAAQDTATDAAAIRYIAPSRRAGANSAMQFGHALGATVFAAWVLGAIARNYGLSSVVAALAGVFVLLGLLEWRIGQRAANAPQADATDDAPQASPPSPLNRKAFMVALCMAGTALFTQAVTSTAAGPFLLGKLRWTVQDYQRELYPIATFVSLAAYALGTKLLPRRPTLRVFGWSGLAIAGLWVALGLLEPLWESGGHPMIQGYAVFEAIATAFWTASLYALLMQTSQGPHRALAFAGLMVLMNLSRLAGTLVTPQFLKQLSFAQLWIFMGALQLTWTIVSRAALRRVDPWRSL